jgi:hypothetical protein
MVWFGFFPFPSPSPPTSPITKLSRLLKGEEGRGEYETAKSNDGKVKKPCLLYFINYSLDRKYHFRHWRRF